MRFVICALLALAAALPQSAGAEWLEASSENFVVYADDTERDIRRFSEQLERYHAAMALLTGLTGEVPSPSNRVTVFVVKNPREVQRLAGNRDIQGFYIPRAGGSVAFVPRIEVRSGQPDFSMITLLHEYTHHFLISTSSFPSTRWLGEGAAEFFSSAEFTRDGGVGLGRPANHRGGELAYARNVTVRELVDPETYEKRAGNAYDAFYGKSWLLYHYLSFNPERTGQLRSYVRTMAGGKSSLAAAQEVFGDLDQLERELERYRQQRRMSFISFKPEAVRIGEISVRAVSAGEAEMMPLKIVSRRGVSREEAITLLADVRKVAARHPNDAAVLAALAEAEFDAGNDPEAIAAADGALAIDPSQVNAYVQKGYALFRRAADADDPEAAYRDAAKPFIALNALENDHPLPLMFFFRSFVESGREPNANAVRGLERAAELAPFDLGLRLNLAIYQLTVGDLEQARANLVPIAYDPHGSDVSGAARGVIELIDAGEELGPKQWRRVLAGNVDPAAEDEP